VWALNDGDLSPVPGLRGKGLDGMDPFGWLTVVGRSRVGGSPRPRLGVSEFWARGRGSWGRRPQPPWLAGPPALSVFARVECLWMGMGESWRGRLCLDI